MVNDSINRDFVLFHLQEASEEMTRTIREIETDPEYGIGELVVAMMHLYHHVNTAWNGRQAPPETASQASEEDFAAWRRFPPELDMEA
ncbi:MAG TPA: hypothetical protein VFO18_09100 [Methylomirabilota bacterium]|nr:hypothetical protein [Methylomirabilota bacterium]